jgi:uncharacterized membrane protein
MISILMIKRIGGSVLFGGAVFLLVLLVAGSHLHIPGWLKVAGRMHPLFLHFPIVLFLISFLVLWLPLEEQGENEWLSLLRLSAAISAVITAIMGLLLSLENDKSGPVLQWHKWGGIAIALSGCLFYFYYGAVARQRALGKLFTTLAAMLIILTSHWGGDLTHGDNYLLAPMDQKKQVPLQQALVFDDVIRPVLEKKCFSCHGGSVSKGGLSLQTMAGLMKGGKTGPLFVSGSPDTSLLIRRIHLPMEEKKHMPPAAKPQLTVEESALLYAWIRSGAPDDKKLVSLPVQDSFRLLATGMLTAAEDVAEEQPVYDFSAADEKKVAALNNNYRVIEPQGKHSPALSVHFYGKSMYSGKALEELLPLREQIIELGLARMPVKDDQLKTVQQLFNLRKLNLNYTDITTEGLGQLTALKKLKQLYLSGTAITAEGLGKVLELPELTSLVIWNTRLDSAQVSALSGRHKKVHIERGFVDDGRFVVALSPPLIRTPAGVFDSSAHIEIKHPFKGVDIRYTLDGTLPDSLNSVLYEGPVVINASTKLVARAFKKGWEGSLPARSLYLKRGLRPDSTELSSLPDSQYRAGGAALLSDGVLGDFNYGNGEWLGYRKNEAACYLYFNHMVRVHNVLLNMLEITGEQIFPPKTVEVWGGMDKKHLKLLGRISPVIPVKDTVSLVLQEKVEFAAAALKCLKIIAWPVPRNPIIPAPVPPPSPVPKSVVKLEAKPSKSEKPSKSGLLSKPEKPQPGWIFISELVLD